MATRSRKGEHKNKFTDEEKASAVLMLEVAGYPNRKGALAQTERETGIHESTLRTWYNGTHGAPPANIYAKKKDDLRDKLQSAANKLVDHLIEISDMGDTRETATALGIVIDKLQLISGEPTENTNQHVVIEYVEDIVTEAATVADERYQAIEAI